MEAHQIDRLACETAQIHGAEVGRVLNAVVGYWLAVGVVHLAQHSRTIGEADVHAAMYAGGLILLKDQLVTGLYHIAVVALGVRQEEVRVLGSAVGAVDAVQVHLIVEGVSHGDALAIGEDIVAPKAIADIALGDDLPTERYIFGAPGSGVLAHPLAIGVIGIGGRSAIHVQQAVFAIEDVGMRFVVEHVARGVVAIPNETIVAIGLELVRKAGAGGGVLLEVVAPGVVDVAVAPARLSGGGQTVQRVIGKGLGVGGADLVGHA